MKLHRLIEYHEKVCCAQELGSCAQGQGHNRSEVQLRLKSGLSNN